MRFEALHPSLGDAAFAGSVEAGQRWVLQIMQDQGSQLVSMLWRILGNEADVCDAYQDAFVHLARGNAHLRAKNARAFVFRTAANAATTILRRKRMHQEACQTLARQIGPADAGDPPHDLDTEHLRETLRKHIARLPEALRIVVVLKDLAELSYDQVAAIADISVASARVQRCRAIQLLAAWMAQQKGSPL